MLANDVRELTLDEQDLVTGGTVLFGIFVTVVIAVAAGAYQVGKDMAQRDNAEDAAQCKAAT